MKGACWAALLCACGLWACAESGHPVRVGSKAFTESVVLGEILRLQLERTGIAASHRAQLGGSRVLFEALQAGEIDVYVEYTGTLKHELLVGDPLLEREGLAKALRARGIERGPRLGFDNSYALGMRRKRAAELRVQRISDLREHAELRYAISHELLARADGFGGLVARYGLPAAHVRGVEHGLAYRAVSSGSADVIDVYTTDPEIVTRDLTVLRDDERYFPQYAALILMRADVTERHPGVEAALSALAGRIDTPSMAKLNAQVSGEGQSEARAAHTWLNGTASSGRDQAPGWLARLRLRTAEHLALVGLSLLAALCVALPLGIVCARRARVGRMALGISGVLQTIPSLALLVLLIPLLGIGQAPAIAALFLYSLLPIVQNTYAGLRSIDRRLLESATVMGLSRGQRLRWVELPLSLPAIVGGIKTAAVINVGTATLGALVGAGGYGQPILTGIRLNDMARIAEGAVPASLLALLVQLGFDLLERRWTPRGLRVREVR